MVLKNPYLETIEVNICCKTCDFFNVVDREIYFENNCAAFDEPIECPNSVACQRWTPEGEGSLRDLDEDEELQWTKSVKVINNCRSCRRGVLFAYCNSPEKVYCFQHEQKMDPDDNCPCTDWKWRGGNIPRFCTDSQSCYSCSNVIDEPDINHCMKWGSSKLTDYVVKCEYWEPKGDQPRRDITK